ncbi:MAG: hypothetical protein HLUCCO02_03795 [Idiomarinaceae bacterium HL-53]|nr:MAG: hypothetical protein HLUCCO02_03795 [Idiomarinaceae bacterium HL-53]
MSQPKLMSATNKHISAQRIANTEGLLSRCQRFTGGLIRPLLASA